MGACATKPKVAKDGDIAPVLRSDPEKKAVVVTAAAEGKSENVVVVKEEIREKEKTIDKVSEIVVDHNDDKIDDDQSAKRPSLTLSNLFKEKEQPKEVEESEAATNPVKQESMEIEKPQNLIIEERSVITLNPIEEVKPSEVGLQEAAAPKVEEQLETEIAIEEVEKHEEKPVEKTEKHQEEIIKPAVVENNEEKQIVIVADEKFEDAPAIIVSEKSLEPEEIKQVMPVVTTETSLLEPKEKQDEEKAEEQQENIVITDEKVADVQANISTEKSMEPEEIKQVTTVTETSSEVPTEKVQDSTVSDKPAEITESTTSSAVVEIAPPPTAIEIKSSQPAEKEEKAEEAK